MLVSKEVVCNGPNYIEKVDISSAGQCFEACKAYERFVFGRCESRACKCWCMDETINACTKFKAERDLSLYEKEKG